MEISLKTCLFFFFTFIHWSCANTGSFSTQEQQQQKDLDTQLSFSLSDSTVVYSLVSHSDYKYLKTKAFVEKQLYYL